MTSLSAIDACSLLVLQAHVDTAESREPPHPVYVTEWLLMLLVCTKR
jgi:hypothetical protein